ncbi:hypothetical protein ABZT03_34575 [Streptomyces sp. NPDC005574]|uniref:hypothetical protein n=1 Tax=Streptomyces sp. NPDC005574 TaxID=3156891 RepID=UPI0033B6699F
MLAATIAADLDAWTRLLLLHDEPELAAAEPETIRRKLYHLPARLTAHARRRTLHLALGCGFHHRLAARRRASGPHLTAGHHPEENQEGADSSPPGLWNPAHPAASRDDPPSNGRGQTGRPAEPTTEVRLLNNRG